MIQLMYQNSETGQVYDLATVANKVSFKTNRRGSPGSVEIELNTDINFPFGSPLAVKDNETKLFFGFLFRVKKGKKGKRTLVFFDQIKYLLRNESYLFKNKDLESILKTITKDFELLLGEINVPGDPLPTMLKEDKTALDIIQEALDEVLVQTGHMLVLWDDYGALRVDVPQNMRIQTVLADASIISDYEYEGSIEDSANMVKIAQDNKETGKREIYIFMDSNNVKRWGKLQHFEVVDEKINEAQIKKMGDMLLKLKNRVYETINLEFSVGDWDFRAGRGVFVDVKDIGEKGWYVMDEVSHEVTATAHTMKVKLFIAGGVS